MSQELERYEQYPLDAASETVSETAGAAKSNPLFKVLSSTRRHWLMVLGIWILVGVPSSTAVWFVIKPEYTATGFVKVEPNTAMVYELPDDESQGRSFDTTLNTQAQMISGSTILREAISDPMLRELPLLAAPNPVAGLRDALSVKVVPKTHLLRVAVTQRDPDDAKRLTQAVLRAYKAHAGGAEAEERNRKRKTLEELRDKYSEQMNLKQGELHEVQSVYGATTDTSLFMMRDSKERNAAEIYRLRALAEDEMKGLEARLKRLDEGEVPTTMPGEELAHKEQIIENDPAVRDLRAALATIQVNMVRVGRTQANVQLETRTREALDKALETAAKNADDRLTELRERKLLDLKVHLTQDLASAKTRFENFDRKIKELDGNSEAMGRNSLKIRQLQDELDSITDKYKAIVENLNKIEVESRRPDTITVDETAEIPSDGKDDKRTKFLPVAALGSLFLGLGLAFLRDFLSGRLYGPEDVRSATNLPLLGVLPSLNDLRRGKITEDDFRESYRTIRATLAGSSPEGMIPKTILVTSAKAAEGKTSLAVSLAASLAESGARVLVIDGDVQAPRISQVFKLRLPYGLRQVLIGERKLNEAVGLTPVPSLEVLLSGRNGSSAVGLLTNHLANQLLKAAADEYEYVIIDSPPVLGSADALIWAQTADGVIISSLAGHSNMKIMRQACQRIAGVGGHILGAVVCNLSLRESYHSYSSYASSNSSGSSESPSRRTPPYLCLSTTTGESPEKHEGTSKQ